MGRYYIVYSEDGEHFHPKLWPLNVHLQLARGRYEQVDTRYLKDHANDIIAELARRELEDEDSNGRDSKRGS